VDFLAIGTAHKSAEYVVGLGVDRDPGASAYSIDLTAGWDSGTTVGLSIEGVTLEHHAFWSPGSATLLVVVPNPGLRWLRINHVSIASSAASDCSKDIPFTLNGALYSSDLSFDDGSAWIAATQPTVIQLVGPTTIGPWVEPDYPEWARETQEQGDANILVTIGIDGTVSGFTVLKSTGSGQLDAAAIAAAKEQRYAPAHLPLALGGAPMAVNIIMFYTFRLDQ
jgi:TonB family protein